MIANSEPRSPLTLLGVVEDQGRQPARLFNLIARLRDIRMVLVVDSVATPTAGDGKPTPTPMPVAVVATIAQYNIHMNDLLSLAQDEIEMIERALGAVPPQPVPQTLAGFVVASR